MGDADPARLTEDQRRRLKRSLRAMSPVVVLAIVSGMLAGRAMAPLMLLGMVVATAVAVGAQLFVLGAHAFGGGDAVIARRPMEWLSQGIAFTVLLWVVVALTGAVIYPWWKHGAPSGWMERWFRPGAFVGRLYLYLVIWTGIASRYFRASHRQDERPDPGSAARLRVHATPVLGLSLVIAALAAGDWILGTDLDHLSLALVPVAGLAFAASGLVGALGVLAIYTALIRRAGAAAGRVTAGHARAVGRWLAIAIVVSAAPLVALAIVGGPAWRAHWTSAGWLGVTAGVSGVGVLALGVLAFGRGSVGALLAGGALALLAALGDFYQLVLPALQPEARPSWTIGGAVGGALVALWLPMTLRPIENRLYPVNDPRLDDARRDDSTRA